MDTGADMRAFVRVVEHRSFSAAATALDLTPSAVSKLVARLEKRLGVRLLRRTTRRLTLTSEGEAYFFRARQVLSEIDAIEADIALSRAVPRGRLHVNASIAFAVYQLAAALPEFLARYPELRIELSVSDRMIDLVEEGADVTIRNGPVTDLTLTARKIAEFERTVCASPDYVARYGAPRTPADLATHACIAMTTTPARWPFQSARGITHVNIGPKITTDNGEAALRLALQGVGIVRLSDMIVAESIRRGLLVTLLTDFHHPEPLPVSALYEAGRLRLPKVRVFVEFLIERFASAPWRIARREAAAARN